MAARDVLGVKIPLRGVLRYEPGHRASVTWVDTPHAAQCGHATRRYVVSASECRRGEKQWLREVANAVIKAVGATRKRRYWAHLHVYGYLIPICTETRSICSVHITPACGRLLDSMRTGGPGSRMWTRGRRCLWPAGIAARSCTMGRQRRLKRPGGSHPDDKAVALRHHAAWNRSNEFLV